MEETVPVVGRVNAGWTATFFSRARVKALPVTDCGIALSSALLLILSFPDFNLWPLAWIGLVPLFLVIAHRPIAWRAFFFGWLFGSVFFYGSCYWLTYSMVHYGGLAVWASYLLLVPAVLTVGIFPAIFAFLLAGGIKRWGLRGLVLAPFVWVTLEATRLAVTGQLWNALGYSQAFRPGLIQAASWGGVYAVGFLIVSANTAVAFAVLRRSWQAWGISLSVVTSVVLLILASSFFSRQQSSRGGTPDLLVIALQPNVPMEPAKSTEEMQELVSRHLEMSEMALGQVTVPAVPRLVIWPESPMNFSYANDSRFRELLARFAATNNTSVLFNSLEPAPNDGSYNSALLVNQKGQRIAQYDKIRLLPFGEYVPLPRWLPGARLIGSIVGDFTPGSKYSLMTVGSVRAGVFICIESAYPSIAQTLSAEGADVLINISNDGYLGRTAVMRQHLANSVFRAVENGKPLLRVTNTGISAYITSQGEVKDATGGFQRAVRTWTLSRTDGRRTLYTKYGDVFVTICALVTLFLLGISLASWKQNIKTQETRTN